MEPEKLYFSYNQIHETIRSAVVEKKLFAEFKPTLIISIGGGGFIPARILRTFLKQEHGKTIPIQAIGLTLYEHEDCCDPLDRPVRKTQWLTYSHVHGTHEAAVSLQGHTILIVDEVDDTRKTLAYAVEELLKDTEAEKAAWLAQQQQQQHSATVTLPGTPSALSPPDSPMHAADNSSSHVPAAAAAATAAVWQEPRIGAQLVGFRQGEVGVCNMLHVDTSPPCGVFVVHNKLKPKKADLPEAIMQHGYFRGGDIEDHWVIYPWDAVEIWEHTDKAHSPTSATAAMVRSPSPPAAVAAAAAIAADAAAAPMVC